MAAFDLCLGSASIFVSGNAEDLSLGIYFFCSEIVYKRESS